MGKDVTTDLIIKNVHASPTDGAIIQASNTLIQLHHIDKMLNKTKLCFNKVYYKVFFPPKSF